MINNQIPINPNLDSIVDKQFSHLCERIQVIQERFRLFSDEPNTQLRAIIMQDIDLTIKELLSTRSIISSYYFGALKTQKIESLDSKLIDLRAISEAVRITKRRGK